MGVSIKFLHVTLEIWGCIFCLIMSLCLYISRNFAPDKRPMLMGFELTSALLLGMDALAWLYRGNRSELGFWMVRISNFAVFSLSDLILILYHAYLCRYVKKFKKNTDRLPEIRIKLVYGIGIAGLFLVMISQYTHFYYYFDEANFYHRNFLHPLAMLIPLAGMMIDASILIQYRERYQKEVFISLFSYIILPVAACMVQIFYYGISFVNISICISAIFMFIVAMMDQSRILKENEREMYELRVQIMLSQIKPHFIYNTLTTIKYLCRKDPQQASETIDEFATYLRGNLDSLTTEQMIPFEKELEHVRNYLAIEKKRFGSKVRVQYDIQEEDFLIPALSMQPLVENAVKHGVTKKEEGGTIKISVEKQDGNYYITIEDDGPGYDVTKKKEDGRAHIGVMNTENRIKAMCGGELHISSAPGYGTKAMIRIPEGQTMPLHKKQNT